MNKITTTHGAAVPPLNIARTLFEQIQCEARAAGELEIMGLLARGQERKNLATAGLLLPAEASESHAEASPFDILTAARALFAQQLCPLGIYHSHGRSPVFHSATDERTIDAFLPAMAEWNFLRATMIATPVVTDVDRALLPLRDGRSLEFTLLGPTLADGGGHERVQWNPVTTSLCSKPQEPQATQNAHRLVLSAGPVAISLGIPEGASLISRLRDPAPLRTAYLYSLVVNCDGDACAAALHVQDYQGDVTMCQSECEISVVDPVSGSDVIWQDSRRTVRTTWK